MTIRLFRQLLSNKFFWLGIIIFGILSYIYYASNKIDKLNTELTAANLSIKELEANKSSLLKVIDSYTKAIKEKEQMIKSSEERLNNKLKNLDKVGKDDKDYLNTRIPDATKQLLINSNKAYDFTSTSNVSSRDSSSSM